MYQESKFYLRAHLVLDGAQLPHMPQRKYRKTIIFSARSFKSSITWFLNSICSAIDDCASNPCQHGSCFNEDNGYICECSPGYTGDNCDEGIKYLEAQKLYYIIWWQFLKSFCSDIDECAPNPCQHGSCLDMVNDYDCECNPGYKGKNCDEGMKYLKSAGDPAPYGDR